MDFSFTFASITAFLQAHTVLSYVVLFLGSYSETLSGPGFFIYGEFFFIPGAILAGAGVLNIWLVSISLIGGGILGDSSSYALGRHFGSGFFKEHNTFFNHTNYKKGQEFFDRYGIKGVFFARLLGPLSWITPFLAGTYQIPYRRFLTYNIPGVIVGIGEFLVAGYFFGSSYKQILSFLEHDLAIAIGIAALVAALIYVINRNNPEFFKPITRRFSRRNP
ncbi:MAG: DedA family protein [Patescibacteria group bacterium]|nr:DedA family protein [Patescibacteria group bacterium]